ncbi:hypothetical protein GS4_35_00310 [Gordonia soli NBRC 108243]|uniref:Uncharacterized protein n=1 Tax=Gordonia soli NBRC 108243 TaxID=1223545 RepID=M0QP75_9ACTN|nr:hypothetical protein GS4_35_00310 [Gordonia soli NBRC 108243]
MPVMLLISITPTNSATSSGKYLLPTDAKATVGDVARGAGEVEPEVFSGVVT